MTKKEIFEQCYKEIELKIPKPPIRGDRKDWEAFSKELDALDIDNIVRDETNKWELLVFKNYKNAYDINFVSLIVELLEKTRVLVSERKRNAQAVLDPRGKIG